MKEKELPPFPPGMINATKEGVGYRFLPKGTRFNKPVKILLPLKSLEKGPSPWEALGVKTYFWDESNNQWKPLPRIKEEKHIRQKKSTTQHVVVSSASHFTLMINAVIKAPDQAGPANFNANAIKDIGAADPASNIDLIQTPDPNNEGTARLSFPFRLPQGRGAYSPQLVLSYNSKQGNGTVGVGWELPVSKVEIDTSRGVPNYDGTERFLLNGSELVSIPRGTNSDCVKGTFAGEYSPRIQSFQRVLRCELDSEIHWEVTEKDGTRFEYGIDDGVFASDSSNQKSSSRLRSYYYGEKGHVGKWFLRRVVDTNGNTTTYQYIEDSNEAIAHFFGEPFVQKYLSQIEYTSHTNLQSTYRVDIIWDNGSRPDPIVSGRLGFKTATRLRLDTVDVFVRNQDKEDQFDLIRSYKLEYGRSPQDNKSLLKVVRVLGSDRSKFYEHSFDYRRPQFEEDPDVGNNPFGPTQLWPISFPDPAPANKKKYKLSMTDEESHQFTQGGGVAFEFEIGDISAGCSVGGSTGISIETPDLQMAQQDINGDAILDRVYFKDDTIRVLLGRADESGAGQFGTGGPRDETRFRVKGLTYLGSEVSLGAMQGIDATCSLGPMNAKGGTSFSVRLAGASAFLTDVDGDGQTDLLNGDVFYRGLPNQCRDGTTPPTDGICPDGLRACPDVEAICFQTRAQALSSFTPFTPALSHNFSISNNVLPPAVLGSDTVVKRSTSQTPEEIWGPYTSARKRLSQEKELENEFYRMNPVIRWDVAHTGKINLDARFRRKYAGGKDGVQIHMLKVTDPKNSEGTSKIRTIQIAPNSMSWHSLANNQKMNVIHGESILFVFDTIDDVSVTVDGTLLDEVKTEISIGYEEVCYPGQPACRSVDAEERQSIRNPTGQLAFLYRFPHDLKLSELPRQTYWKLMPLLGPPQPDKSGQEIANRVVGRVIKKSRTPTPVHVRIRCESTSVTNNQDETTTCPLGTILGEHVFGANEVGETDLTVNIPEPFVQIPFQGKEYSAIDPIRLLFEIDGENGVEIEPSAVEWSPEVQIVSIRNVKSIPTDLTVESFNHFPTNPNTLDERTFITVVRNIGAARAGPSTLKIIGGDYPYPTFFVPTLRPGQSHVVVQRKPSGSQRRFGNRAVIDANGNVDESNEENNELEDRYEIVAPPSNSNTDLPDLIVETVSHIPEKPTVRDKITWIAVVRNIGGGEAGPSTLFFAEPSTQSKRDIAIPALKPGESFTALQNYKPRLEPGIYAAMAEVDSSKVVNEANETNNQRSGMGYEIREEPPASKQPTLIVADNTMTVFPPEEPLVLKPEVLYRVHPARHLEPFRVEEAGEIVSVTATADNPKHPLIVTLTAEESGDEIGRIVIDPQDIPSGKTATTKHASFTIPKPGLYFIRGYTEASFDTKTSFTLKAEIERLDNTHHYALVRDHLAEEDYIALNAPTITLLVFAGTEAESVAREYFPKAQILAIDSEGYSFPSGHVIRQTGDNTGIFEVSLPNGQRQRLMIDKVLPFLVGQEVADFTIAGKENMKAYLPSTEHDWSVRDGVFPCCPTQYNSVLDCGPRYPWEESVAGIALLHDCLVSRLEWHPPHHWGCYWKSVCAITKVVRISLPVNLLTADFGAGYTLPALVGEVPHSLDTWSGGHHSFFYGAFNGEEELTCIGPLPCEDRTEARIYKTPKKLLREKSLSGDDLVDPGGTNPYEPCEEVGDTDGDGIRDCHDDCRNQPEDYDGYEDYDGCPEPCEGNDLDSDSIGDCRDKCPYFPEDFDGDRDEDGCPDDLPPTHNTVCGSDEVDLSPEGCEGAISRRFDSPDPGQGGCMTGADSSLWICADGTHPTRKNGATGGGSVGNVSIDFDGPRRTWSFGASQYQGFGVEFGGGAWGMGIQVKASFGTEYTDRDVLDWNGDGILDFSSPNYIEFGGRGTAFQFDDPCYITKKEVCIMPPGVRESLVGSFGIDIGGGGQGAVVHKTVPDGTAVKHQGRANVSFGLGAQVSRSAMRLDRIDINGDRLPDILVGGTDPDSGESKLLVRLNLGHRLGALEPLGLHRRQGSPSDKTVAGQVTEWLSQGFTDAPGSISEADNVTLTNSKGGGGGIKVGIFGGDGAFSESKATTFSQRTRTFSDVNGDGLIDVIEKYPGSDDVHIAFNMGGALNPHDNIFNSTTKFRSARWIIPPEMPSFSADDFPDLITNLLKNAPDAVGVSGSRTTNWSGTSSFTVFFINGRTSYSYTEGSSRMQMGLMDIDGDGLPDRVLRTGEESSGGVQVQKNLFGGANLLKMVTNPLGGTILLDYELGKSTEEAPGANWLLTSIAVDQTTEIPEELRLSQQKTTIKYEDRYYDRYEKESFGYRKVIITREGEPDENGDETGVIIERLYENRDYWLRGSLLSETTKDPRDNARLWKVENSYESVAWKDDSVSWEDYGKARNGCLSGLILPKRYLNTPELRSARKTPCDVREVRLKQAKTAYYEKGSSFQEWSQIRADYDNYGNARCLVEQFGPDPSEKIVSTIGYDQHPEFLQANILDRAVSLDAYLGTGVDYAELDFPCAEKGDLLRQRDAEYDERGNLRVFRAWVEPSDPTNPGHEPNTITFTLDVLPNGFISHITDANGYWVEYTPDRFVDIFSIKIEDSFGLQSGAAYDYGFQLITNTTDVNGNTIEREYDAFGRLWKVWSPYERASTAGVPSLEVDYNLSSAKPVYALTTNNAVIPGEDTVNTSLKIGRFVDSLGREIQTQATAEVNGTTGRIVSGKVRFDALGRATENGEPFFVDNHNFIYQPPNVADPRVTVTKYDALNRPIQLQLPGNRITTWDYSITDHPRRPGVFMRQETITDAEGKERSLYYDAVNRLVAVEEVLTEKILDGSASKRRLITSYRYLPTGELLSILDANEVERSFEYDLAGRRTVVWTPDTGRTEYAYDNAGNMTEWTDQELCDQSPPLLENCGDDQKVRRIFKYNRLIGVKYPTLPDETYVYGDDDPKETCSSLTNVNGRICSIIDAGGQQRMAYGSLGEVVKTERTMRGAPWAESPIIFAEEKLYDSFGRLLRLTYPDGEVLKYHYDAGGRTQSVSSFRKRGQKTSYVDDIFYDEYGKQSRITYGNGVTTVNTYEPDTQRLDVRRVLGGNSTLLSLAHEYDKVGNPTRITSTRGSNVRLTFQKHDYTYDDLHRLDTFSITGAGRYSLSGEGSYDYDDVGNITQQQITFHSGLSSSKYPSRHWEYAYSNSSSPNLPQKIGPYTMTYNARGAMTSVSAPADAKVPTGGIYRWNDQGRLRTSQRHKRGGITSYTYSHSGTRLRKVTKSPIVDKPANPRATIYPSQHYSAEFRRRFLPRSPGPGFSESESRTKHIYVDGQQIASIVSLVNPGTQALSEKSLIYLSSSQHYLHTNQLRSTLLTTTKSGAAGAYYEYLPYGEIIPKASRGSTHVFNLAGFNGKERDPETGLQYFGARYYDPKFGRWISPDNKYLNITISNNYIELKEPQFLNLYTFVINRPISLFDPDGRQPRRGVRPPMRPPKGGSGRKELPFELPPYHRDMIERSREFAGLPGLAGSPTEGAAGAMEMITEKFKNVPHILKSEIRKAEASSFDQWIESAERSNEAVATYKFKRNPSTGNLEFKSSKLGGEGTLSKDDPDTLYLTAPIFKGFEPLIQGSEPVPSGTSHPDYPHSSVPSE